MRNVQLVTLILMIDLTLNTGTTISQAMLYKIYVIYIYIYIYIYI